MNNLQTIEDSVKNVLKYLEGKDNAREELLKLVREVIRVCRRVVFSIHAGNLEEARKNLEKTNKIIETIFEYKVEHPDLYYSGSVISAQTEFVESCCLLQYVSNGRLPSFESLKVEPAAYLLGLGDFIGELRRYVLDLIRNGRFEDSWKTLKLMEYIYSLLVAISLPEALTPGLRRKVDTARSLIENTRKDILYFERSMKLERLLESYTM